MPSTVGPPSPSSASARPITTVTPYDSAEPAASSVPLTAFSAWRPVRSLGFSRRESSARVEGFDLVGVLGVDAAALELGGGGELFGVGEPLVAEDRELLDPLRVVELLHHVL